MDENKPDNISDLNKKFLMARKMINKYKEENDLDALIEETYKMIKMLDKLLEEITDKKSLDSTNKIVMIGIGYLNIGLIYSDLNMQENAKEQFVRCLDLLKDNEMDCCAILPAILALNQLGICYANLSKTLEAKVFLERAEELFINFTSNIELEPIDMGIGTDDADDIGAKDILERFHTLTIYYLAQIYDTLKDKHRTAVYCHRTLRRQIENCGRSQDLDYIEWSLNTASISQYFIEQNCFSQARHHLAAASCILQKYENILKAEGTEETSENLAAKYETYNYRFADVARCWAKYGISLLRASKERLLKKVEEDQEDIDSSNNLQSPPAIESADSVEDLRFINLEPELETFTSQITDKYLLDFDDAKPVFLYVLTCLEKAKEYYTLNFHAMDHAQIAQDISQTYRYLIFFEENEDNQTKMHKRRIDTLESIVKELNPQYYRNICRELWIELGETYLDILEIKNERLGKSDETGNVHMIKKINHLAKNSIKNFQLYLDSLDKTSSSDGIESFPDDHLYAALYAYFHIGSLYNKIISSDKTMRQENTQKCIEAYRFIVDYCNQHPDKEDELRQYEFIGLCKEFLDLMLHKVDKQQKNP